MRRFFCTCGHPVFFENAMCIGCQARLGFDPGRMEMLSLRLEDDQWVAGEGTVWSLCANGASHGVCNWLLPADQNETLCRGCRFNRTVPNLTLPANRARWQRLEQAKKRLLYTLMELKLPLELAGETRGLGLMFDFIEDTPGGNGFTESRAFTGYSAGVITVNLLEADDAAREEQRQQMNEKYRTLLGHLRHESGHYFWHRLAADDDTRGAFLALFGDESANYAKALETHYKNGPPADWRTRFISAYASAHPAEDWAESWGHYLHIYDALETAAAHGLTGRWPTQLTIEERISLWRELSVTLNELNRSVGLADAYPFVLNTAVELKLTFVDRVISLLQTPQ